MMKRLLLVLLLAVPAARADEASKTAKVKELFQTMHMQTLMDQLSSKVLGQIDQMVKSQQGADKLSDAQKKVVDEYLAKMTAETKESIGWPAVEPEYVKLYAATYSEQEIEAILAFYKSPAGQTMLAKTPELTQGGIKIVQARLVAFQPKMTALQSEFSKALIAASPTKPAAK